jgi:predicted DNA-binding transcriptional regulator AlpA
VSIDLSQRIAVTRDQAAEMVGLSRSTILRAIAAGDLIEHYVTSKPVIFVDELRAWIAAAPTEGPRR